MGGFLSMLFSSSSKYDISQIKVGDTKNQVRGKFGEPEQIINGSTLPEQWVYTVPFRIYVSIEFNHNGLVIRTYRSGEG